MKTVIVAIICIAAAAFAVCEIIGLVRDIKKRKNKSKEQGVIKK